MSKRLCVVADFHSGSDVGLTPPKWQTTELQANLWNLYVNMIENIKPIDVLVVNGDSIDGKAGRWGSTGLITADRGEQSKMAATAIDIADAKEIYMTRGTPYHSGRSEDWEDIIASMVGATIEDQLWLDINNVIFDVKHYIPGSQVPYGRHTAVAKDRVWNLLWAEMGQQPKSDILIRSHVHSFNYAGGTTWLAMTTPALQGLGSKFGSRIPSGTVDYGITWFDIEENGDFTWDWEIVLIQSQKTKPYIVGEGEEDAKD